MTARYLALAAAAVACSNPARGHRLDEYLQATFIAVDRTQITADVYLTPGVAVLSEVLAEIDMDKNGECSEAEQRGYAARVIKGLSLALDGSRLTLELTLMAFPTAEDLRAGRGDIHLALRAKLPVATATTAKLWFENRHLSGIAAYQVNCLAPRDPSVRIGVPNRDPLQSTLAVEITFER